MPKRLCATVHFLLPFALPTRPHTPSASEESVAPGADPLAENATRHAVAEADRTLKALLDARETPGLDAMIRRARRLEIDSGDDYQRSLPDARWLARQYGLPGQGPFQDAPLAPFMLLADGGDPTPASLDDSDRTLAPSTTAETPIEWACLEPAHIEVTHDRLVLAHPQSLDITDAEARTLAEEVTASAAARGLHFVAPTATRWYLGDSRGTFLAGLQGASPLRAAGRSIDIWLPIDESRLDAHGVPSRSSKWIGFQTELQMAWHEHATNNARAARHARPVNAVWLHGRGRWPSAKETDTRAQAAPFSATFADSPAARGLAIAAKQAAAPLPTDFAALVTALSSKDRGAGVAGERAGAAAAPASAVDCVLVQSDALSLPMVHEDWRQWLDTFAVWDRQWFSPALQALKDRAIDEIRITLCGEHAGTTLSLRRGDLKAFWRRRTFAALLP
jgi:hypothetical protein